MHLLALDRPSRILQLAVLAPEIGDEAPPCARAANDTSSDFDRDPPPRPASAAARPRRWEHLLLAA